jgi:HTH-type transcriptional regulator, competence development regulator
MDKTFGTLVRQLHAQIGYSLRELARRVDLSPNFLSKMELGHFPPPGEQIIVLIAETLDQNKDEMLALAGKVSSDLIEIILQRPKETGAVRPLANAASKKRERAYETPGGLSCHVRATEPERNRAEGTKSAPPGWILARVLAQHDEAATIGRIAAREGRFSAHRHLPCTRCPPKLLKAIREEDGAVAPRSVIATT